MDFDDFDDQLNTSHLLFSERRCRVCGEVKDLLEDFYLTRKGRGIFPSAYSYECKECTKERTIKFRKSKKIISNNVGWEYPDW